MHLTEEQLQRVLHREEVDEAVQAHLDTCSACRDTVDKARVDEAEIFGLLQSVDRSPPVLDAESVANLARTRPSRREPRRLRWAAVIGLVCVLGGIAYALPGSPVRAWLGELLAGEPTERTDSSPAPLQKTASASGIAVDPGSRLAIMFDSPRIGSHASVVLTDEARVMIEGPAGLVRFTSEPDRLLVAVMADSVTVHVSIPRAAILVELRLGGRVLLVKRGDSIDSPVIPRADLGYLLPLSP